MKNNLSTLTIVALMIAAAITRLIPHLFNFTAIGAMALFGGAAIRDKRLAFLLPLLVMFATDAIIGLHSGMMIIYGCFAFTVLLGTWIRNKQSVLTIASASLLSSVVFFLVTNLPFWYTDINLYPVSMQGTIESYTAALPFFGNQVAGDLFYNAILFGAFAFAKQRYPALAK